MLYRFRSDCSARWQPLREAVGEELGVEEAFLGNEEGIFIDLLFPSYGSIIGIPEAELEVMGEEEPQEPVESL